MGRAFDEHLWPTSSIIVYRLNFKYLHSFTFYSKYKYSVTILVSKTASHIGVTYNHSRDRDCYSSKILCNYVWVWCTSCTVNVHLWHITFSIRNQSYMTTVRFCHLPQHLKELYLMLLFRISHLILLAFSSVPPPTFDTSCLPHSETFYIPIHCLFSFVQLEGQLMSQHLARQEELMRACAQE